ncbi:unnamed protein product [Adineta steineri]|uniref:HTH CENPB-type domain-containing protein n=1 Tax=Adineta steineri TaxID=433720 RepID=A0A814V2I8_9BILA|nr:unnamed protein product [Adineta steineri]CAF1182487.1 unnamed protein product [Adineta steineri]
MPPLTLIKDKKLTVKDASTNYHISCATLYARLSNRRGGGKLGRPTILSGEEENVLIHVIHKYQEWQHPLTRSDLISIARIFMIELGKQHITEDSLLREWFYSFQARWYEEIKLVETYKLESIRSLSCTQLVVDRWFERLQKVLTKLNLFNRPEAIYNVDKSGFGDDPGRKQIIIKRDSKYGITSQGGSGEIKDILTSTHISAVMSIPAEINLIIQRVDESSYFKRIIAIQLPRMMVPEAGFHELPAKFRTKPAVSVPDCSTWLFIGLTNSLWMDHRSDSSIDHR